MRKKCIRCDSADDDDRWLLWLLLFFSVLIRASATIVLSNTTQLVRNALCRETHGRHFERHFLQSAIVAHHCPLHLTDEIRFRNWRSRTIDCIILNKKHVRAGAHLTACASSGCAMCVCVSVLATAFISILLHVITRRSKSNCGNNMHTDKKQPNVSATMLMPNAIRFKSISRGAVSRSRRVRCHPFVDRIAGGAIKLCDK